MWFKGRLKKKKSWLLKALQTEFGNDLSSLRGISLFSYKLNIIRCSSNFLHNEQLHCLYRSYNIVRVIKSRRLSWAGHIAKMEEGRSAFKILTGTPAGKRPLGRYRRRWENNIRMGLKGINTKNWVDSAQDRDYWRALVNLALNHQVP